MVLKRCKIVKIFGVFSLVLLVTGLLYAARPGGNPPLRISKTFLSVLDAPACGTAHIFTK